MYEITDKESYIRSVQRFLLELHYETESLPFLFVDGIYGDTTRAAVAKFQALQGLPSNGTLDYPTWKELYKRYRSAINRRRSTSAVAPDTPLPVTIGTRGMGVRNLQQLMNALARRYRLPISTDVSGVYSYATSQLASLLRGIYRLPPGNTVDGVFFDRMQSDYRNSPL